MANSSSYPAAGAAHHSSSAAHPAADTSRADCTPGGVAGAGASGASASVHRVTWPALTEMVDDLATQITRDGPPQVLVGVLRGGMIPAVLLAHRLGCRQVRAVEVTHTTSDAVNAAKTAQPVVTHCASLGDLHDQDVLVVDDIAGTGATITATCQIVARAGARRVRSAACLINVDNWCQPSSPEQVLTYLGHLTSGWVIFPWEQR